jgi:hypothetical protein
MSGHPTWRCPYCATEYDASIDEPGGCDTSRLAQLEEIENILNTAGIPEHDNTAVRVKELALRASNRRMERTAANSPYKHNMRVEQTAVPCPVHFYRVSGVCTCLCVVCGKPQGEREHDECIPF